MSRPSITLRTAELRPFAMPFPDPQGKGKPKTLLEVTGKKLADVLHRRVFQKVIPRPVIVMGQYVADGFLEIGEVDHHSALGFAFNCDFNLVGVTVQRSALRVGRQKMGAVYVFGHTKSHGVRIT